MQPGRSAIPTPPNDQSTSKALKRRSFLPHLSRHDDSEDKRLSSGRESRSTNGTQEEEQGDATSDNSDRRSTVASAASRLRRPLSMMLNSDSKPRPQSIIRPSTRDNDAQNTASSSTSSTKSSLEANTVRRTVNRTAEAVQRSASVRTPGHARTTSTLSNTARNLVPKHAAAGSTSPSKNDRPVSRREVKPLGTTQLQSSPTKTQQRSGTPQVRPSTAQPEELSPEVIREQLELFQLSLKHERAIRDLKANDDATRSVLSDTHKRLRRNLGLIIGEELERERQTNLVAMSLWQSSQSYLMDRLRILQKVHQEVMALTLEGSAFARTIDTFRTWIKAADQYTSGERIGFVSPLTSSWRQGHASSALRVQSLQLELAALPPASQPSSVFTLMSSCQALLDGMLQELELITQIEREMMRQDKLRVDEEINALPQSVLAKADWVPRWQRVS